MELKDNSMVIEYIDTVLSYIKLKTIHQEISLELLNHIEETTEELLSEGLSEDEAVKTALSYMGSPEETGRVLSKVHKSKPDWLTLIITLLLSGIGLFTIYTIQLNSLMYVPRGIFERSLVSSLIGLGVIAGLYFFDYRRIKKYSIHIYVINLALLFFALLFGGYLNGIRVLNIGPITINITDLSPTILMITLPGILEKIDFSKIKGLLTGSVILIIPAWIILSYPSPYSALIYTITFIVIALKSGLKRSYVFTFSGLAAVLFTTFISANPYRIARFLVSINPAKDPNGAGYLQMRVWDLLQSTGLWGHWFEPGKKMLPAIHTDFIFTYIIYTFGWVAGSGIAALIILFIFRIMKVGTQVKSSYGRLLVLGASTILIAKFILNMLAALGIVQATGVGFPFISYGGSQYVVNMALIGIILSVYRTRNLSVVEFPLKISKPQS